MSNTIFRKDGTAQGVAKQRYIETLASPNKRVIYDPYSYHFVSGANLIKLMGHKLSVWITQKFAAGFHQHLISRTRFIDDMAEKCTSDGKTQYVILGAGYDLRGHRLKLPPKTRIFEVDQLEVQQQKISKLPPQLKNNVHITYVSVDFNRQTLKEQLLEAGYDVSQPTIFTLEGVSQYITEEALGNTLEEVAQLTQNTSAAFYLSYVNQNIIDNPAACFGKGYHNPLAKAKIVMSLSEKVGEPWITFYTAQQIRELFSQYGFTVAENKTLADLNKAYFAPLGRQLQENQIFNLEHNVIAFK